MKCKTCGLPLWFAYFIMGRPLEKRIKKFKEARDCVDLTTVKNDKRIRKEVEEELSQC